MRSITLEHAGFDHGLSHLAPHRGRHRAEHRRARLLGPCPPGARAVRAAARLLPLGGPRWRSATAPTRQRRSASRASRASRHPCASDADQRVLWANLPNPHQACFVLDARLAARNLTTSRFLSPARSLSGPQTWGATSALIERSAIGPICDDVPTGYRRATSSRSSPAPANAAAAPGVPRRAPAGEPYFLKQSGFARIPLDEAFVDDRAPRRDPVRPRVSRHGPRGAAASRRSGAGSRAARAPRRPRS